MIIVLKWFPVILMRTFAKIKRETDTALHERFP